MIVLLQLNNAEIFEDSPCTDLERANDWFIPDTITDDVVAEYALLTEAPYGIHPEALKARRNAARAACYDDCPMAARLHCLSEGLRDENSAFGIYGGYTEGQRRAVRKHADELGRTVERRPLAQAMITAEKRAAAQPAV